MEKNLYLIFLFRIGLFAGNVPIGTCRLGYGIGQTRKHNHHG